MWRERVLDKYQESFFIGSFINNTIAADKDIQRKARNSHLSLPQTSLGHKA